MTRRSNKRNDPAPGWVWMLFGLALGLVVAVGVYLRGEPRVSEPRSAPAQRSPRAAAPAGGRAASDESRFEFYDILPRYEVVIPEVETEAGRALRTNAVEEPGSYVLQAGSFGALADADRRQASLALLGIESRIQRVTVDDEVYHRVRIGPISDLTELNRVRRQLLDAHIDTMLMKVAD